MGPRVAAAAAALVVLLLAATSGLCQAADMNGEVIVAYSSTNDLQQLKESITAQGCQVLRGVDGVQALVVRCAAPAPGGDDAVAAAAAAASTGTERLSGLPGVTMAVPNTVLRAPRQPDLPYTATADAAGPAGSCTTAVDPQNPDIGLGRAGEGVPYGVRMVQADSPEVMEVARLHNKRVMFCVIDSGLDRRNQEFPPGTTGCRPNTIPRNRNASGASPRTCMQFDTDGFGHGTHVAGIIAAMQNGRGIVGVSAAAAQLYVYKFLDSNGQGSADGEVAAWADCIAELDARQAAGNRDLKMVVSMSYGSWTSNSFSQDFLTRTTAARSDILWVAAAGNDKIASAMFPARYKEVLAVSAVDPAMQLASFSNYGPDVFLAAPGVSVLSTQPLALTQANSYSLLGFPAVATQPELPAVQAEPDFFARPAAVVPTGSSFGEVTAPLVDCGLGLTPCANATGKICLIQRGQSLFCLKAKNCLDGGGVGVLIFNNANNSCEAISSSTLTADGCPEDVAWPLTMMLTRAQGEALQAGLAAADSAGSSLMVTQRTPAAQTQIGLGIMSGTSQATPAASAVAGLVWSAFPACTPSEIRAALASSALKGPGQTEERSNKFGYGIVQAKAALQFLASNPCAAVKPLPQPSKPDMLLSVTPTNPREGDSVTVRVRLQDPSTKKRLTGVAVSLLVRPSAASLSCSAYSLVSNRNGIASTTCKVLKAGKSTLVARVAASKLHISSSAQQQLSVGLK